MAVAQVSAAAQCVGGGGRAALLVVGCWPPTEPRGSFGGLPAAVPKRQAEVEAAVAAVAESHARKGVLDGALKAAANAVLQTTAALESLGQRRARVEGPLPKRWASAVPV